MGPYARLKKIQQQAVVENDVQMGVDAQKKFDTLMEQGLYRRLYHEREEFDSFMQDGKQLTNNGFLSNVAREVTAQMELGRSTEEQYREIQRRKFMQRNGLIRFFPSFMHKYVNYLISLRKDPKPAELARNTAVGLFFSMLTIYNTGKRAFTFAFIGNLMALSILLARNQPVSSEPLVDKRAATWSVQSYYAATAISLLFTVPATLITRGLMQLISTVPPKLKWTIAFGAGIITSSIGTSWFEVFEEVGKGGWRWKRSQEGFLPEDMEKELKERLSKKDKTTQAFDFAYDPDVEENAVSQDDDDKREATFDMDMEKEIEHYDNWFKERRDSRKPPLRYLESRNDVVLGTTGGANEPFLPKKPASWMVEPFVQSIKDTNRWREIKPRFVKDYSEFEPIKGPFGFRDKTPEWLRTLSSIYVERTSSRKTLAREYGSYRKTMWRRDRHVVLKPTDGAGKEA